MSKAILVIDKPSNCIQCPCIRINSFYDVCQLAKRTLPFNEKEIPDWCPLRPMPEKKETICYQGESWSSVEKKTENVGWNACIDEIGGGANETDKETHQST